MSKMKVKKLSTDIVTNKRHLKFTFKHDIKYIVMSLNFNCIPSGHETHTHKNGARRASIIEVFLRNFKRSYQSEYLKSLS